jgi:hypothetical protein
LLRIFKIFFYCASLYNYMAKKIFADKKFKYKAPIQILSEFFALVPKSLTHTGLLSVKTPCSNISCFGPFKKGLAGEKKGTKNTNVRYDGKNVLQLDGQCQK